MINKVILVGRITKDPELRFVNVDMPMVRFSLAVNRNFVNKEGNRETDFINCVVWRKQAENLTKYINKGSLLGIEGSIRTGSYETEEGTRRFTTEVLCDNIRFLEPKKDNNFMNNNNNTENNSNQNKTNNTHMNDTYEDNDLPF